MEELRVGIPDGGKLYRQAGQRQGLMGGLVKGGGEGEGLGLGLAVGKVGGGGGLKVFSNGGIPLEYARAQVDGPGTAGWDHTWVRG